MKQKSLLDAFNILYSLCICFLGCDITDWHASTEDRYKTQNYSTHCTSAHNLSFHLNRQIQREIKQNRGSE